MKFGKRLKQQVRETLPGWRDKFLSYKDLKKLVRLLSSPELELFNRSWPERAEAEFIYLLNSELHKFNAFFMEQEEDFIIRHEELKERIKKMVNTWGSNGTQPSDEDYTREMCMIRREVVNFHGEMVLLENYSNINYTGLVKILKKYDKRMGGLLRMGFIDKVLQQPFFTTDLVSKLIKECENTMDAILFPAVEGESKDLTRTPITVDGEGEEIFRNTVAALMTMQEIRSGSSTQSHFSLPPLNLPDSDLIQSLQLNSTIPII